MKNGRNQFGNNKFCRRWVFRDVWSIGCAKADKVDCNNDTRCIHFHGKIYIRLWRTWSTHNCFSFILIFHIYHILFESVLIEWQLCCLWSLMGFCTIWQSPLAFFDGEKKTQIECKLCHMLPFPITEINSFKNTLKIKFGISDLFWRIDHRMDHNRGASYTNTL